MFDCLSSPTHGGGLGWAGLVTLLPPTQIYVEITGSSLPPLPLPPQAALHHVGAHRLPPYQRAGAVGTLLGAGTVRKHLEDLEVTMTQLGNNDNY